MPEQCYVHFHLWYFLVFPTHIIFFQIIVNKQNKYTNVQLLSKQTYPGITSTLKSLILHEMLKELCYAIVAAPFAKTIPIHNLIHISFICSPHERTPTNACLIPTRGAT